MDSLTFLTLASSSFVEDLIRFPWGRMAFLLFVLYLFLCLYAWLFADRILFPAPRTPSYAKDDSLLFLPISGGGEIACRILHPQTPKGLTLLYSHGNAEDLGRIEDMLGSWVTEGWTVVAYDYPGYGHSPGKPSEEGCYQSIDAVYAHLTGDLKLSPSTIVAWGRSLGTGPSCYLAIREKLAGLILETPFVTAFRTVTETPVLPWDRFRNLQRAPSVKCPSLVIHGHEDEIVPFRHGKRVFEALPQPKKFVQFEKSGHNDLPETGGKKYRSAIRDFLTAALEG